jgi:hypothetical protein
VFGVAFDGLHGHQQTLVQHWEVQNRSDRANCASSNGSDEKLCHNCDTKPVLPDKIDYIDAAGLLILRNLLKTLIGPKIPSYTS